VGYAGALPALRPLSVGEVESGLAVRVVVEVPDVFSQAFVMEKDSKRFPKSGGWGYAVFNYDAASDKFTADPKSLSDCGNACHTAVKAKDYIFHPYQKR